MIPKIFKPTAFSLLLIISSCGNSGSESNEQRKSKDETDYKNISEINVNFDPEASINNLYSLNEKVKQKIESDPECVAFFEDYWNDWVNMENSLYDKVEYFNIVTESNKKQKSIDKSNDVTEIVPETYKAYRQTKKMFKGMMSTAVWKGIPLLKLEQRRKKLYNSFSEEKLTCALAMEFTINRILHDCYYEPLNKEGNEARRGINFRCVGEQLNNDGDAMDFVKGLISQFEDFEKYYRNFRSQIIINKLTNSTDYTKLVELGNRIIASNGNMKFSVKPSSLNDFFEKLSEECKMVNIDNRKFIPPIEDWNEEKRNNLRLIIADINSKIKEKVRSLNEPLQRSKWSPWEHQKS